MNMAPQLLDLIEGCWFGEIADQRRPSQSPHDDSLHGGVLHNGKLRAKVARTHAERDTSNEIPSSGNLSKHRSDSLMKLLDSADHANPAGVSDPSSVASATPAVHIPSRCAPPPSCGSSQGTSSSPDEHHSRLGTWAQRQFRLQLPPPSPSQQQAQHGSPLGGSCTQQDTSSSSAGQSVHGQRPAGALRRHACSSSGSSTAAEVQAQQARQPAASEQQCDIAWRWRFQKRWRAECAQPVDIQRLGTRQSCGDSMEDAIGHLQACGEGWHGQAAASAGAGGLLGAAAATPGLLWGASPASSGPPAERAATWQLASAARQARLLLEQQASIERGLDERWCQLQQQGDGAWAGCFLDAVQIDDWGMFAFLLLRVAVPGHGQRLLVRGRNGCSRAAVVEGVQLEVQQQARLHGMALPQVEAVGGGVMEWCRDRDRQLQMHSGFVSAAGAGGTGGMTVPGLLKLAAVMAKQALPMHYSCRVLQ